VTRFYLFLFLVWLPTAGQAQAIASFSPASGNVGTLVTLTGTRLDLVTGVAINGTSSVILDQTSTALRLLVMPGATTGPLTTTGGVPATAAAAFTVTRTALGTAQQGPKLVGTGGAGISEQGGSVAFSADGTTLAVGGFADNNGTGAAWVFTRSGTSWSQQGLKLVGTGAVGRAAQGTAVALSADGSTLAVGGYHDDNRTGATWVFTRSGTGWSQQGPKLVGTGAVGLNLQGWSVALSADGTTLAVGGSEDDNRTGATWVFSRSGTGWSQQGPKLVGTGTVGTALQGCSVALSANGTTLAVGGRIGAGGATWVFSRSGTGWSQQGPKLVETGAVGSAGQGFSVALSADGNTLAIGGPEDNNSIGATWVFTRSGTGWSQQGPKLVVTGAIEPNVHQGYAVTLSADGTALAVGGYNDNNYVGATWVFSMASSPLAQRAAAGPRATASVLTT